MFSMKFYWISFGLSSLFSSIFIHKTIHICSKPDSNLNLKQCRNISNLNRINQWFETKYSPSSLSSLYIICTLSPFSIIRNVIYHAKIPFVFTSWKRDTQNKKGQYIFYCFVLNLKGFLNLVAIVLSCQIRTKCTNMRESSQK